MIETEVLKKVRKIEIKTRTISNEIFAGKYHSAFKGRGMSFSEVREYRIGDDVRDIDWNVTARSDSPHIKTFEEERELTMMLLIDVSGSRYFGTKDKFKQSLITEIAAVLSFSAAQNNDKIGCILFSDTVEKYIPPKKGRNHILRIIRELLEFKPQSNTTNIGEAVRFLTSTTKKRSTAFILSDFMDCDVENGVANFELPLKIAVNKHDIVGIKIFDQREQTMPNVGIVELEDGETGEKVWVDTSSKAVREHYENYNKKLNFIIENTLVKYRIDSVDCSTEDDYVKALMMLFKKR
ncbi:MAG: DUF58 domain-containing protein [Rikenellaceae bacterium]